MSKLTDAQLAILNEVRQNGVISEVEAARIVHRYKGDNEAGFSEGSREVEDGVKQLEKLREAGLLKRSAGGEWEAKAGADLDV